MNLNEAFKRICKSRNVTMRKLSVMCGLAPTAISRVLCAGNPSVNALNRYFAPIGYTVALVPVGTVLPEGCYVIEGKDHDKESK